MATSPQTAIAPDLTGLAALTLAAPVAGAGNGDTVQANSILLIKNGAGSSMTVTIKMTGTTVDGQAVADKVVTVGATTNMLIGPFTNNMKQATGTTAGQVTLEFSSITTLTRAYIATPW